MELLLASLGSLVQDIKYYLEPDHLHALVDTYAWLAPLIIIVWTFIEGETIVIIMGYLASIDGTPNIAVIALAAFMGGVAGDQTWFFVGRRHGKGFVARRPGWQKRAEKVYVILHRHQYWLILGFRFLYGLRNITPFALGMSEVKTSRFCILNVIGGAIWATTFSLAGYFFGMTIESSLKHLKYEVLIGFVSLIALIWLTRTIISHRRAKREVFLKKAPKP